MFDERVATAAAVYFLSKVGHGKMTDLRLMKLLYLAERESIIRYGAPITGATFSSMPKGPVLSEVLNLMTGIRSGQQWNTNIGYVPFDGKTSNHCKLLNRNFEVSQVLSEAEIELLGEIWETYHTQTKWDLVALTHTFPEWDKSVAAKTAVKKSKPLPVRDILVKGTNLSEPEATAIANGIEYYEAV